ncbi:DUF4004 family protein [Candidatus Bipolaricaulota bacterium]|nr:DUF4004 family protein [Candidatus Bipolaricaulota bacterium]
MLLYLQAMSKEMMSKKKVLSRTGISYGQFYRWKRKGLIPDRWVVRKSTYTGHETFLPKEKIVERILKIKRLKKENTLDEIAKLLSPELTEKEYTREEVKGFSWARSNAVELFTELFGEKATFSFLDVLGLKFVRSMREKLADCELRMAVNLLWEKEDDNFDVHLMVARQESGRGSSLTAYGCDRSFCIIADGRVKFDPSVDLVADVYIADMVRDLKVGINKPRKGNGSD